MQCTDLALSELQTRHSSCLRPNVIGSKLDLLRAHQHKPSRLHEQQPHHEGACTQTKQRSSNLAHG